MRDASIRPEELSAYVDGELSRTAAAAVARAAAQNPAVAAQIATLREMKAALGDLAPDVDLALPSTRRQRRIPVMAAIAASVAAVIVVAGLVASNWTHDQGTVWARSLEAHHTTWAFAAPDSAAEPVIANDLSALLPLDLTAARLTFVGRENLTISGSPVQRLGYAGTRGCRVSLYVFPFEMEPDPSVFSASLLVRLWAIRAHRFALMADGMAQARFNGLADAVEEALRSGQDLEPSTRQLLAKARRTSPPCNA